MRAFTLGMLGVNPASPVLATHPRYGEYLRFEHGEHGRGRHLVHFPLGRRDFPAEKGPPPADQEYRLVPVSEGRAHILVRGRPDGDQLVLWFLSPGFRGGATFEIEGKATVVAKGREAQGDAGRMGGSPCPVVLVSGPCRLTWLRTGRLYGTPAKWRAVWDGTAWIVEPDDPAGDAAAAAFGG